MRQSELAKLVAMDAEQLHARAQSLGVSAFLGRPVQREVPNTRFLQNTIRGVEHANQRAQESVLWAAYEAQKMHERRSRGEAHGVESGSPRDPSIRHRPHRASTSDGDRLQSMRTEPCAAEQQPTTATGDAASRLVRSPAIPIRGRGGVGSRVLDAPPDAPGEARTTTLGAADGYDSEEQRLLTYERKASTSSRRAGADSSGSDAPARASPSRRRDAKRHRKLKATRESKDKKRRKDKRSKEDRHRKSKKRSG